MTEAAAARPISAHAWAKEEHEWYVEPRWVGARLIEEEGFTGSIWDPCCGGGHIVDAARAAGRETFATDIVNRGYSHLTAVRDFFEITWGADNIVMNPPFEKGREFALHALELATRKVAMVFPMRRLNAAGKWIKGTPLYRIWFLTPRPSMPPGHVAREYAAKGKEPSGGKQDFCVLVWLQGYSGPATTAWLHRDRSPKGAADGKKA